MAKKKVPPTEPGLNAKHELFCQYYTKNDETFGNATLSYAEAYDFELGNVTRFDKDGNVVPDSERRADYDTCSVSGYKLLRKTQVQARITVLLNEMLKDEVVDSQLAKLVLQDRDNTNKIAAIREYNKLRGRIIDKTQQVNRLPFGESDLSSVIATLPQERQDYFYGVITSLIEEAELSRSARTTEGGGTR